MGEWQSNVEIFIRDCSVNRAVVWVQSIVGPLVGPVDCGVAIAYHSNEGSVIFTPEMNGGPLLSVWFNTPARPWATDVDCARAAAHDLNCVVLCDPGKAFPEIHPLADVFLEISNGFERLLEWDQIT